MSFRWWKKKPAPKRRFDPQLVTRVATLDGPSLFRYFDSTLAGIGTTVDAFHYHGAPSEEVITGIDILYALWEEIARRDV